MMIGVAQVIGMKPTLRSFFSGAPASREGFGRGLDRKELRDRGQRGRGADRFQEGAARGILGKHRAHHGGGDDALVALVLALGRAPARSAAPASHAHVRPRSDAGRRRSPTRESSRSESKGSSKVDMLRPFVTPARRKSHSAALRKLIHRPAVCRPGGEKHARFMPLCLLSGHRSAGPPRSAATDRATIRSRSRNTSARPSRRRSSARGTCSRRARP